MRLWHKHFWEEIERIHMHHMRYEHDQRFKTGEFTLLTYRCPVCYKYKQKDLRGHIGVETKT